MSNFLQQNEHVVERVLRIIIGAVLLALVFVGPKTPFGWIGIIPLATGLVGSCPLYSIIGVSTCPIKNKKGSAT